MPQYFDRSHFVSVVHLLVAGDIQARTVVVGESFGIELTLDDSSKVVWANTGAKNWAYTMVLPSGDQKLFHSEVRWDAPPEDVAFLIATHEYGSGIAEPE